MLRPLRISTTGSTEATGLAELLASIGYSRTLEHQVDPEPLARTLEAIARYFVDFPIHGQVLYFYPRESRRSYVISTNSSTEYPRESVGYSGFCDSLAYNDGGDSHCSLDHLILTTYEDTSMPLPLPNRRPSPRDRRLVESQASAAASRAEAIAESSARQEYNRADARVGTRRDVHGVCEQLLAGVDRRYSELATGRHVDPVDPVVTATRVLDQDVYARRTPWVDDGVQGLRIAGSSPYHGTPGYRGTPGFSSEQRPGTVLRGSMLLVHHGAPTLSVHYYDTTGIIRRFRGARAVESAFGGGSATCHTQRLRVVPRHHTGGTSNHHSTGSASDHPWRYVRCSVVEQLRISKDTTEMLVSLEFVVPTVPQGMQGRTWDSLVSYLQGYSLTGVTPLVVARGQVGVPGTTGTALWGNVYTVWSPMTAWFTGFSEV